MTSEQASNQREKAIAESIHERARITRKYRLNRILDDGVEDALNYAKVELASAEAQERDEQAKRWRTALTEAHIGGKGDLGKLRQEISREGHELIDSSEGDELWENEGRALVNLSKSF